MNKKIFADRSERVVFRRIVLTLTVFLLASTLLHTQEDSRYDSGKNLPFNQKAGDVDPQTGNVTLSETDLSLPGRAGMDFTFGRIWKTNQSNVFTMSRDPVDGSNRLTSETIEDANHIGVGWSTSLPYILSDHSSGSLILSLFFGGGTYEIDQTGIESRNPNASNLLWYDLLDKRIYKDSSKAYSDGPVSLLDLTSYGVADEEYERNTYQLILQDNSSYFFRSDGKLMTQIDKSGLNEIWYYYDALDRLAVVVDSIGREIRFSYDADSNLEKIEWDVTSWIIDASGTRVPQEETRSITYIYKSGENYSEISSLSDDVIRYETPYVLESVTNAMGHTKEYEYSQGTAAFSFESERSHWQNVYLLLSQVRHYVDENNQALSERHFEYEVPATGMYTKYFYGGYTEYYKVSREYSLDRHMKIMGERRYIYHENNEAGNFNQYTTTIEEGKVKQLYTYSVSSVPSNNDVLDTLTTSTTDGYIELKDFVYNSDRIKILNETFRGGQFVFEEKYIYDLKGNLTEYTDPMGLVTVKQYDFTYSIPIRETRRFQSSGESLEYNLERVLTNLGQVEQEILYINENGTSRGLVTEYQYDDYGNVIQTTDPAGIEVFTIYDSLYTAFPVRRYQLVTEQGYASKSDPNYWFDPPDEENNGVKLNQWSEYNSDGSVWLEVDASGFAVEHYYDKLGTEITTIFPDENDVLLDNTDENEISNHSNFQTFLTNRHHNPGIRMNINYEDAFVKTNTDFEYDDALQKWSTLVTAVQEDGLGNTEEEITYGENELVYGVKKMQYDLYGRMIALTDPDAGDSYSTITVNGELVKRYDKTWLVKYDDLGRTIKVLYPDTGLGSKIKNISYNDRENSVTTIDPEGSKLYEKMDWNGNVIKQIAYGNSETASSDIQTYTFEYDQLNRMTQSTDPEGLVTKYRFDERDLLIRQIYGDNSDALSDDMLYNDRGLLVEKTDRKEQAITFSYDEAGRNTEVHYFKKDSIEADEIEYKQYDPRGNVIRVENKTLIEQFEFDGAGRLLDLNRRIKDGTHRETIASVYGGISEDQVFSYTYDYTSSGLLNHMTYPDGSVHNFTYDQYLGVLATIGEGKDEASLLPFVTNLEYNKSMVIMQMDYANLTTQLWDFDNRKRISRIRIASESVTIEDLNYVINGSGNVLSINDNTYSYDGFHRIIGASTRYPEIPDKRGLVEDHFGSYDGGTTVDAKEYDAKADLYPVDNPDGRINGPDYLQALIDLEEITANGELPFDVESFAYDGNGNRLKLIQNGDEFIYSYGIRNRLERIDLKKEGNFSSVLYAEYTYDENGNTTSRIIYGEEGVETVNFEYDVLNRLVKTVRGDETTEYFYDNAGNRVIKSSSDGSLNLYLRHGAIAVAMDIEVEGDENDQKGSINRYVLSGDLVAGRITRTINADGTSSLEKNYYHLDHLNSTKVVTDEAGEVVVNYTYRAFGEQLRRLDKSNAPTEDLAKYSYGGKELDADINLYYFNARFYDATTGRFINVDPVQDGTNWYVYVSNNPLSFVDPTGLMPSTAMGAIAGGIGGLAKGVARELTDDRNGVSVMRLVKMGLIGVAKGVAVGLVIDATVAGVAATVASGGAATPVAAVGVIAAGAAAAAVTGFATGTLGSLGEQALYGDELDFKQAAKDGVTDAAFAATGATLAGGAKMAHETANVAVAGIRASATTGTTVTAGYGKTLRNAKTVEGVLSRTGDLATGVEVMSGPAGEVVGASDNQNNKDND